MKFHKEHSWAKVSGDYALIGISDYAQKKLTSVVFVELPKIGEGARQETRLM